MSHWYTQGRIGAEHRADLDREADREALLEEARAVRDAEHPRTQRRLLMSILGIGRRGGAGPRTLGPRDPRPAIESAHH